MLAPNPGFNHVTTIHIERQVFHFYWVPRQTERRDLNRNQVLESSGEVTDIKKGDVMCKVTVSVPASEMSSVLTSESLQDLDLKIGDKVQVVAKAINVQLLKD